MRILLLFLIPFYFLADAQVKEINFLGKNWYLHGYDFRIKGRFYSPNFYTSIVDNADYPSEKYESIYRSKKKEYEYDYLNVVNTLSVGFVFRPFFQVNSKFIKQIEFVHNLEVERVSGSVQTTEYFLNTTPSLIKSNHLGYNPRIVFSTPSIAQSFKLYVAADGYGYIPLSGFIYNQLPSNLATKGVSYKKNGDEYNDRIQSSHYKYGAGGSLGLKMNLNCNLNFHIEYSIFDVYTKHSATNITSTAGNAGVQFGLRYKFGTPSEEGSESRPSSTFW